MSYQNRRDFLIRSGIWFSGMSLTSCLPNLNFGTKNPNAKVKSFVNLFMNGGPSQMELFDYKPDLYKNDGKTIRNFLAATGQVGGKIIKPESKFSQHGESGAWISNLLPNIAKVADELAFIKSMTSPSLEHMEAQKYFHTGSIKEGNPFIGSWISHIFDDKKLSLSLIHI